MFHLRTPIFLREDTALAHIIAFMDDALHAETPGSSFPKALGSKRQASAEEQRRMVHSRRTGVGGEIDAAPVRMDRVNALRASIADGSYVVSASDVADKILHSMLKR